MKFIEYNYDNKVQYSDFIRKYNKSKCLSSLNIQTFCEGKKIFLMVDKGLIKKYKIIGYVIVYEKLKTICMVNEVSENYEDNSNVVFISDFMIDYIYRKKGLGKFLAKYIIDEVYRKRNIILQPDGDGNWFWKKFGFKPDEISKKLTLILKR